MCHRFRNATFSDNFIITWICDVVSSKVHFVDSSHYSQKDLVGFIMLFLDHQIHQWK